MAGTGGINFERPGVQIWWETGEFDDDKAVIIRAVNAENGDVGIAKDNNDGLHLLTYPPGTYTDHITVYVDETDEEDNQVGAVIAEFDIGPFRVGD